MLLSQEYRENWSSGSKIIFRSFFLYFGLYILFMFLGSSLFAGFFKWVGSAILKSEGRLEYFPTGSGDTTMAYISLCVQSVLAVVGTIVWTILDRKRASYNKSFYWFLVVVRVFLIFFLISYGFAKIYKTQFPAPSLNRLLQPIGEMSPMGLAWTYMGHSEGFNLIVGLFEALGGFLLIPRRTQTLGALIAAGVMFQILLMNLFFDIPVKIFSFHLLLLALFILSTDIQRIVRLFVQNKDTTAYTYYNPINDKLYHKIIFYFKLSAAVILVLFMGYQGYTRERGAYGDKREKPSLYGIWEVKTFIINEEEHPPLLTDTLRWRYLVIDYKDRASLTKMDGSRKYLNFRLAGHGKKLSLFEGERNQEENFLITTSDTSMTLDGHLYGDKLRIEFTKKDLSKMSLTNRAFHWVNEYPYNL